MSTDDLAKAIVTAGKGLIPSGECSLLLGYDSSEGTMKSLVVEIDGAGEKQSGRIACDPASSPKAHDLAMITAKHGVLVGSHPSDSSYEEAVGNFEHVPPHEASDLRASCMVVWLPPKAPEVFGAVQLLQWFHQVHQARRIDFMDLPL